MAAASMDGDRAASATRSPSGHGISAGSPSGYGSSRIRQRVDVLEGLVGGEDDAADALAERRAHDRRAPRGPDGHRLPLLVDDVVAAPRRPHRPGQEGELLGEDVLEAAVRREQPVAHEDGLLSVPDHLALELPVVVGLFLLGRGRHRGRQHAPGSAPSARASWSWVPPRGCPKTAATGGCVAKRRSIARFRRGPRDAPEMAAGSSRADAALLSFPSGGRRNRRPPGPPAAERGFTDAGPACPCLNESHQRRTPRDAAKASGWSRRGGPPNPVLVMPCRAGSPRPATARRRPRPAPRATSPPAPTRAAPAAPARRDRAAACPDAPRSPWAG